MELLSDNRDVQACHGLSYVWGAADTATRDLKDTSSRGPVAPGEVQSLNTIFFETDETCSSADLEIYHKGRQLSSPHEGVSQTRHGHPRSNLTWQSVFLGKVLLFAACFGAIETTIWNKVQRDGVMFDDTKAFDFVPQAFSRVGFVKDS